MAKGIFDDDLLGVEESPADEAGQGSDEQAAGPDTGQPAQGEASATEEAAQEKEAPQQEQAEQQPLLGKFKSAEDLAKSYQELERKLGARDEEKEQLRQQLAMLQGYLQALPQLMGQQPPQGVHPAQQQAQAQPDEHEKLLQDYEQMYPGITKAFEKRFERLLSERLGQVANEVSAVKARQQQADLQEQYNRQALQLATKYPDFKELAQDMLRVYEEEPLLAVLPKGMEIAYERAKSRRILAATQAAQTATEKQAARLPGSTGPRAAKPADPEKQFLDEIFGSSGEPKGIFDDI